MIKSEMKVTESVRFQPSWRTHTVLPYGAQVTIQRGSSAQYYFSHHQFFPVPPLKDRGPIRHDMAGRYGGIGLRIKQGSQSAIIKLGGQGPAKAERLGTFEEFLDGADTDLGTDTDLTKRDLSFQPGVMVISGVRRDRGSGVSC